MPNPATAPFVLLEFPHPKYPVLCGHPIETIVAYRPAEVCPALRAVQRATEAGFYAVGYLSYEAAVAFDPALMVHREVQMPLLWFGLFEQSVLDESGLVEQKGQLRLGE